MYTRGANGEHVPGPGITPSSQPGFSSITLNDSTVNGRFDGHLLATLKGYIDQPIQEFSAFDGLPAMPGYYPPSLLMTAGTFTAIALHDESLLQTGEIVAWVLSCWNEAGGYFLDEYAVHHDAIIDHPYHLSSSAYSPVVATAAALRLLHEATGSIPAGVQDGAAQFLAACFDPPSGGFTGAPPVDLVTLENTCWAVKALDLLGELQWYNATAIARYIVSLQHPSGLFANVNGTYLASRPSMNYSIHLSRLAVDALVSLDKLGELDVPRLKNGLVACYHSQLNLFKTSDLPGAELDPLASVDALHVFSLLGYHVSFPTRLASGVFHAVVAIQDVHAGGWFFHVASSMQDPWVSCNVLSTLLELGPGDVEAPDVSRALHFLDSCKIADGGAGLVAYSPVSRLHPSLEAISNLVRALEIAGRLDLLDQDAILDYLDLVSQGAPVLGCFPDPLYPSIKMQGAVTTWGDRGIQQGSNAVFTRTGLGGAFSPAELSGFHHEIQDSQLNESVQGLSGLHLVQASLQDDVAVVPYLQYRAASLDNTRAVLDIIKSFTTIGAGELFNCSALVDLAVLESRLEECLRMGASTAWFAPGGLIGLQATRGFDESKLHTTRLALDIIDTLDSLGMNASEIEIPAQEMIKMARDASKTTLVDVANYHHVLTALDVAFIPPETAHVIDLVLPMQDQATGLFRRHGLVSLKDSLAAFTIPALSCLDKLEVAVSGIERCNGIMMHAGTGVGVQVDITNALTGAADSIPVDVSLASDQGTWVVDERVAMGASRDGPYILQVPLREAALGPGEVSISVNGRALDIPFWVHGQLAIAGDDDGTMELYFEGTNRPCTLSIDVVLVEPGNPSNAFPAHGCTAWVEAIEWTAALPMQVDPDDHGRAVYAVEIPPGDPGGERVYYIGASRDYCNTVFVQVITHDHPDVAYLQFTLPFLIGLTVVVGSAMLGKNRKRLRGPPSRFLHGSPSRRSSPWARFKAIFQKSRHVSKRNENHPATHEIHGAEPRERDVPAKKENASMKNIFERASSTGGIKTYERGELK